MTAMSLNSVRKKSIRSALITICALVSLLLSKNAYADGPLLDQEIWEKSQSLRPQRSNEQTAVDLGRRLLFQIEQRSDQGLPPKSKIFSAVIDDDISYRERDHRHGNTTAGMLRQIIRVSRFWREYAGHSYTFIPWPFEDR